MLAGLPTHVCTHSQGPVPGWVSQTRRHKLPACRQPRPDKHRLASRQPKHTHRLQPSLCTHSIRQHVLSSAQAPTTPGRARPWPSHPAVSLERSLSACNAVPWSLLPHSGGAAAASSTRPPVTCSKTKNMDGAVEEEEGGRAGAEDEIIILPGLFISVIISGAFTPPHRPLRLIPRDGCLVVLNAN